MKRIFAWILLAALLFCMAGCSRRDTTGMYPLNEERNEAVIDDAGKASD